MAAAEGNARAIPLPVEFPQTELVAENQKQDLAERILRQLILLERVGLWRRAIE